MLAKMRNKMQEKKTTNQRKAARVEQEDKKKQHTHLVRMKEIVCAKKYMFKYM